MKKNTILKDTLILTVITLISGLLLGLVYQITIDPIAEQKEKEKQEAYMAVFADADSFELFRRKMRIWQLICQRTATQPRQSTK